MERRGREDYHFRVVIEAVNLASARTSGSALRANPLLSVKVKNHRQKRRRRVPQTDSYGVLTVNLGLARTSGSALTPVASCTAFALESFIEKLVQGACEEATASNAPTLTAGHVYVAISSSSALRFPCMRIAKSFISFLCLPSEPSPAHQKAMYQAIFVPTHGLCKP